MRFTTRNDATNLKTLAARLAGPKTTAARRNAVAERIRDLNPHLADFETLPPDAPIVLPEDVDESAGHTDADPRIAHALRIAEEATKAARETIRRSFERAEEEAEQKEKELRRRRDVVNDASAAEQIGRQIEDLRQQRARRDADLERLTATLEDTSARVAKLRERKRS